MISSFKTIDSCTMKKLSDREDQIMRIIWKREKVLIRDIIKDLPEPKLHYNTIATIVKILVKKGFLRSELIGNTHQYSPLVDIENYRAEQIGSIKKNYFSNSLPKIIAHFAKNEKLTEKEINEIIETIKTHNDQG